MNNPMGAIHTIHFVGIGGVGMAGIAEVLLNLGYDVQGSDLRGSRATERLQRLGAVCVQLCPEGQTGCTGQAGPDPVAGSDVSSGRSSRS